MRRVIIPIIFLVLLTSTWGFLPGLSDLKEIIGGSESGGVSPQTETPVAVYVVGQASDGSKIFEGWMEPNKDYSGVYKGKSIRITSKPEWGSTGFDQIDSTWEFGFVVYYPSATHNIVVILDGQSSMDPEGNIWKAVEVRYESQNSSKSPSKIGLSNLIMKFGLDKEKHFSIHAWGKNSAPVDAEIADRIKTEEIKIVKEGFTLGTITALKASGYGQAVAQPACMARQYRNLSVAGMPSLDTAQTMITKAAMNIKDVKEYNIPDEERKTLFLISYGGPAVNLHAQRYAMNKSLPLYFTNKSGRWGIVDRQTGKTYYDGDYGIVIAIPRVRSVSVKELNLALQQGNKILLYRVIIAGITRKGTQAGGYWYVDMLEMSEKSLERITDMVCGTLGYKKLAAGMTSDGVTYLLKHGSIGNLGKYQKAVEVYVSVLLTSSLDERADIAEVKTPGYVVLVKYSKDKKYKLLKIYPIL